MADASKIQYVAFLLPRAMTQPRWSILTPSTGHLLPVLFHRLFADRLICQGIIEQAEK